LPERLSVSWVVATSVGLLRTIVVEGNTTGGKSEDEGRLELGLVVELVEETGVIVVVDEDTESIEISEVRTLLLISVLDAVHGLAATEDILDGVVHGVVEQTSDVLLVRTNVSGITVEALTHLEDTSGLAVLGPEVHGNLRDGVNTNTIERVGLHKVLDPVLELLTHPGVALVEIGKISETAVLDHALVAEVSDLALVVVVVTRVEGVDLAEVHVDGGDVVGNNIDHDVHALVVGSADERLKVVLGTEVTVDLLPVSSPVAVVATVEVVNDGEIQMASKPMPWM